MVVIRVTYILQQYHGEFVSMDITGPFMQASIHKNWYQWAIIDTYSKHVWDDYLAAKDEVYIVLSDFCVTEITK